MVTQFKLPAQMPLGSGDRVLSVAAAYFRKYQYNRTLPVMLHSLFNNAVHRSSLLLRCDSSSLQRYHFVFYTSKKLLRIEYLHV